MDKTNKYQIQEHSKCSNSKNTKKCKSSRVYKEESGSCSFEYSKIDLTVETEDIDEQKIFRYIVTNVGSKDICGDLVIQSKNFNKIIQCNILLKDIIVIEETKNIDDLQDEEARAFINIKNKWIHSDMVRMNFDNVNNAESFDSRSSNSECFLFGVVSKATPWIGGYFVYFRISNSSNVDAVNVSAIINFDGSMIDPTVFENILDPFSNYTHDNQKLIFNYDIFPANSNKLYRITFDSTNNPFPVVMELVIRTDTPNECRNLNPNMGYCNVVV